MGIKVLHVMAGAEFGGAETAFVDLIAALKARGVEQQAVIRHHGLRSRQLEDLGIPTLQAPFRKWFDHETSRLIRASAQSFKPDIVQTWMDRASVATPKGPYKLLGWQGGYYKKKYYKNSDYIAGVTPDIVDHMVRQGWPLDRTAVLRTFSTVEEDAVPVSRVSLDTPEDVPLLLALGRLHSDKAFDTLLKVLVNLPDAYLWIAGDGVLRDELPAFAKELGVAHRVRFLGWRTDRAALLKACDVCAYPSRVEPFGTVTVEAWAYRVPLVTVMSAGPKAHVRHGENGLIVGIDDVEALTQAINRVIHDKALAAKLVEQGWRDYQHTFTEEAVATSYLAFYKRMLAD